MKQAKLKKLAAERALSFIEEDMTVGVGTGSTVDYFIDALASIKHKIDGCVASSEATKARLKKHHIPVYDLNTVSHLPVYIDGADEVTPLKAMIKGGGGALTREKIIAAVAKEFICIVDESKQVNALGTFALPVEVIPMARSYVARELVRLGGDPEYRAGFTTDNGNIILDVHNMTIHEPIALEEQINNITGVVTCGLFAKRGADKVIVANKDQTIIVL